jgi:hypothetical protein
MYSTVAQPHDTYRVGDFLTENLVDTKWKEFKAAVAFVKRSGTEYIYEALAAFAAVNTVSVSIGLDHGGSSVEGFNHLLNAIHPTGQLWVYKNNGSTFHPKVYLFKNATHADLIIGSGNLTKGGLYENAEMGVRLQLNLANPNDATFLADLEKTLDLWSTAQPMRCLAVTDTLIVELNASGDLPTESEAVQQIKKSKAAKSLKAGKKSSLFNSSTVQTAPHLVQKPKVANPHFGTNAVSPSAATAPTVNVTPLSTTASSFTPTLLDVVTPVFPVPSILKFGMTLQTTDVGVGQTTTGAAPRSPEIFIPIGALDMQPTFWGWVSQYVPDTRKYKPDIAWRIANALWVAKKSSSNRKVPRPLDKLDWEHVKVNLVGHNGLLDVAVWFNPNKIDIRFRESNLRSAGNINDILVIEHAPTGANYHYVMEVISPADTRYATILPRLTKRPKGISLKKYGYF